MQVTQGGRDLFVGFRWEMFNLDVITSSVSLLLALLPGITEKDPRNRVDLLWPPATTKQGKTWSETGRNE